MIKMMERRFVLSSNTSPTITFIFRKKNIRNVRIPVIL